QRDRNVAPTVVVPRCARTDRRRQRLLPHDLHRLELSVLDLLDHPDLEAGIAVGVERPFAERALEIMEGGDGVADGGAAFLAGALHTFEGYFGCFVAVHGV